MDYIDIVLPWVDGSDINHINKRVKYQSSRDSKSNLHSSMHSERFSQSNEVYYSLNSIIKFMPWVRNIYLVTDGQIPKFIKESPCKYKNVIIVDHKDIFYSYEEYLPTFNSRTLASMFWRIKGLSEKFIVFNDDIIILQSMSKEQFFIGDKFVLYGQYQDIKRLRENRFVRKIWGYLYYKTKGVLLGDRAAVTQKTARELGFDKKKFFLDSHMPLSFNRSVFECFFANDNLLKKQIKYKFRSGKQFLPEAINNHTLLKKNKAVIKDDKEILLELSYSMSADKQKQYISKLDSDFEVLCIQSLEKFDFKVKDSLYEKLDKIIF